MSNEQGFTLPTTLKAIATSAKSGSQCTAEIGGIATVVEVARDLSVASGDGLLVVRSGSQWYAIARTGLAAPTPPAVAAPPPPKPKPDVVTGTLVCSPIETRSRQGSKWRGDTDNVYQGQYGGNGNHVGCAFFGRKPNTLSGATCTKFTVKIYRLDQGGTNSAQDMDLRLVTERFRPSGAPSLGSSTDGPNLRRGEKITYSLPTSWGQAFIDGSAGGLAIYKSGGSPYVITAGRSAYGPAWTVSISWRK